MSRFRRAPGHGQCGDSLVEVVISVFLVAIIGFGFLPILTATATNADQAEQYDSKVRALEQVVSSARESTMTVSSSSISTSQGRCLSWFDEFAQRLKDDFTDDSSSQVYDLDDRVVAKLTVNNIQVTSGWSGEFSVVAGGGSVSTPYATSLCSKLGSDSYDLSSVTFRLQVTIDGFNQERIEVITLDA